MSLIVQKYGGTSVSDVAHFENVARRIAYWKRQGHDLVVVVSAMAGETNRFIDIAMQASQLQWYADCMDCLLATGEQVSVAILSIALRKLGYYAVPFLAAQINFQTDSSFGHAHICSVDTQPLRAAFSQGHIPIVAGFQGVDAALRPTTLGRGGSDMTAVILAALLRSDECQIYTDVDGVYTTDPRFLHQAKRLQTVGFDQMLEMSDSGSKVLMTRSVSFACCHNMPLRVLASYGDYHGKGTLVKREQVVALEGPRIVSVAFLKDQGRIVFSLDQSELSDVSLLLSSFAEKRILVDVLMQNTFSPKMSFDVSLSFPAKDYQDSVSIVQDVFPGLSAKMSIGYGKLSLVGYGLKTYFTVASEVIAQLSNLGAVIYMFSHSEIKISCLLDEHFLEPAVALMHDHFHLDRAE